MAGTYLSLMSPFECEPKPSSLLSRLVWGGLFVLAGFLLLGFNTGMLPVEYKRIVFSWAMFLSVFGLVQLLVYRHIAFGLLLSAMGGYLLWIKLGFPHPHLSNLILPVILVLIGFKVLFRHRRHTPRFCGKVIRPKEVVIEEGRIEENAIFSGTKRIFRGQVFRGGEVNCVFGGTEIDLTESQLPVGITNLEVNCVFGGVTLTVPERWTVHHKVHSLFGGFVDRSSMPHDQKDHERILEISGSCVFGGGEIRYTRP